MLVNSLQLKDKFSQGYRYHEANKILENFERVQLQYMLYTWF